VRNEPGNLLKRNTRKPKFNPSPNPPNPAQQPAPSALNCAQPKPAPQPPLRPPPGEIRAGRHRIPGLQQHPILPIAVRSPSPTSFDQTPGVTHDPMTHVPLVIKQYGTMSDRRPQTVDRAI
jgi:hypothetical protein